MGRIFQPSIGLDDSKVMTYSSWFRIPSSVDQTSTLLLLLGWGVADGFTPQGTYFGNSIGFLIQQDSHGNVYTQITIELLGVRGSGIGDDTLRPDAFFGVPGDIGLGGIKVGMTLDQFPLDKWHHLFVAVDLRPDATCNSVCNFLHFNDDGSDKCKDGIIYRTSPLCYVFVDTIDRSVFLPVDITDGCTLNPVQPDNIYQPIQSPSGWFPNKIFAMNVESGSLSAPFLACTFPDKVGIDDSPLVSSWPMAIQGGYFGLPNGPYWAALGPSFGNPNGTEFAHTQIWFDQLIDPTVPGNLDFFAKKTNDKNGNPVLNPADIGAASKQFGQPHYLLDGGKSTYTVNQGRAAKNFQIIGTVENFSSAPINVPLPAS